MTRFLRWLFGIKSDPRDKLRLCHTRNTYETKYAYFHAWTDSGQAIVEYEGGTCGTLDIGNIQFVLVPDHE